MAASRYLLKLGIRKDVAVSVNKESMSKRSSKMYFPTQVLVFHFTKLFRASL